MEKYYVHISSLTGNTQKLAERVLAQLPIQYEMIDSKDCGQLTNEKVILFFWCRRSNMDPLTLKVLSRLSSCDILAIGTMGSYPDSPYGIHVHELVEETIRKENHFLATYICRGQIDPERTMRRRALPKDSLHYLDDAAYERHLSSHGHPDEKDIQQALLFLDQHL